MLLRWGLEGCHVKSQIPTQAKNARKLSDAIIARRYHDLQKLRDQVRKAETSCAFKGSEKPRNQLNDSGRGRPDPH